MKFVMDYPVLAGGYWQPELMVPFVKTLEELNFSAVGFSDHPAPSAKWLQLGGHESLDPTVAMAFVAGATEQLGVMANVLVVPYRNPLLQASAIASVDVVSGGRTTFVLGSGYLRSEFAALGVEFDERNALFDEGVEVMRRFLSGEDLEYEGRHFKAIRQRLRPLPTQKPHPPLWVGGNSGIALDRVGTWASGWSAMIEPPEAARTARTRPIRSLDDLEKSIVHIHRRAESVGRDPGEIAICASSPEVGPSAIPSAAHQIDEVARMREAGVGYLRVSVEGEFERAIDRVRSFAELVMGQVS